MSSVARASATSSRMGCLSRSTRRPRVSSSQNSNERALASAPARRPADARRFRTGYVHAAGISAGAKGVGHHPELGQSPHGGVDEKLGGGLPPVSARGLFFGQPEEHRHR